MGVVEILDPVQPARTGGYKVDVSRGERNGRVSSEWFNRPDDERYLSLDDLWASVKGRSERSRSRVVQTADIRVEAARDCAERLHLVLPKAQEPVAPTHWAFGQLASIVGAPASYLRQLPAPLAGINLQYGLTNHRAEQVKTFETEDGRTELRAVTGPDYGRIHDHELVEAVQRIAGNGTGDTRWKVPGVLDWSTGVYNPDVEISRDTTTLYASDRDVFLFLVDDHNPIEAGRLPDGSPDLYFRGFYCFCIKPTPFRALSKKFHRQEHASVRSRRRGRHTMPFCAEPGDPIWKTRDGRKDRAHDSRTGLAWLASRRRDLFDHAEWPAVRAVYVAGWASPAPNSNSVPSTHILCINTASLRANATLARLAPRRFTSRSAQAFKADGLTRNVMIAFAAS